MNEIRNVILVSNFCVQVQCEFISTIVISDPISFEQIKTEKQVIDKDRTAMINLNPKSVSIISSMHSVSNNYPLIHYSLILIYKNSRIIKTCVGKGKKKIESSSQ